MNYLAMRTQFLSILNRKDCTDTLAKTFFDQAVARCQRELRAPFMERELNINTATDVSTVIVPTDFLEMITFVVTEANGYSRELQSVDLGTFVRRSNTTQGASVFYTRRLSSWYIADAITAGSTAYVDYYGELTPLVLDTDEPTLALVASDLVIYFALSYAADYFIDERGGGWETKAVGFLNQVQGQASDAENRSGTNAVEAAYHLDDCS